MTNARLTRRTLTLSTAALLGGACANNTGPFSSTPDRTPVQRHGRLQVSGAQILDRAERPVTLRGMSLFWSTFPEGAKYYNPEVVRWLRDDWGVNLIRAAIGVDGGGWIANPERETRKAETVIEAAMALGLYVIVDWHAHQPRPEAARIFFGHIARKYGAYPGLIYETYNEPLREHDWASVIKPYHQAVIPTIRAHDPHNLIVAGTQTWSQDVDKAAADPLRDRNLAYTLHFYAGTHRQELRDKAQAALDRGAALFVTEWGTSEANGDDTLDEAETRRWWDFMENRGISHANWAVDDKDETSAALRPGASPRGGWTADTLSPSGRLVRAMLRQRNGVPER